MATEVTVEEADAEEASIGGGAGDMDSHGKESVPCNAVGGEGSGVRDIVSVRKRSPFLNPTEGGTVVRKEMEDGGGVGSVGRGRGRASRGQTAVPHGAMEGKGHVACPGKWESEAGERNPVSNVIHASCERHFSCKCARFA